MRSSGYDLRAMCSMTHQQNWVFPVSFLWRWILWILSLNLCALNLCYTFGRFVSISQLKILIKYILSIKNTNYLPTLESYHYVWPYLFQATNSLLISLLQVITSRQTGQVAKTRLGSPLVELLCPISERLSRCRVSHLYSKLWRLMSAWYWWRCKRNMLSALRVVRYGILSKDLCKGGRYLLLGDDNVTRFMGSLFIVLYRRVSS